MSERNFQLGMNCKLYYSTTKISVENTPADADWEELTCVSDVNLDMSRTLAPTSTRGGRPFKTQAVTLIDLPLNAKSLWKPGDPGFDALLEAAWAAETEDTEIALLCLDGDLETAGSQGPCGNYVVSKFPRSEELEGTVMSDITVNPSSFMSRFIVGT